jgi:hypothetical protein
VNPQSSPPPSKDHPNPALIANLTPASPQQAARFAKAVERPELPLAILTFFFIGDIIVTSMEPRSLLIPHLYHRPQFLYGILSLLLVLTATAFQMIRLSGSLAKAPFGPTIAVGPPTARLSVRAVPLAAAVATVTASAIMVGSFAIEGHNFYAAPSRLVLHHYCQCHHGGVAA